jgi:hypothetical protein
MAPFQSVVAPCARNWAPGALAPRWLCSPHHHPSDRRIRRDALRLEKYEQCIGEFVEPCALTVNQSLFLIRSDPNAMLYLVGSFMDRICGIGVF